MIILGLDLGKTGDPTALCAVDPVQVQIGTDLDRQPVFQLQKHVRHLQRFPLGTRYMDIVDRVVTLTRSTQLASGYQLVVDATGVGVPVVEQLRAAQLFVTPVTITSGLDETFVEDTGFWRVSKHNLVSAVVVELENHTLRFAPELVERDAVVKELMNFRMKITSHANDTYEAWRDKEHDDLVLALCLACWGAQRYRPQPERPSRQRMHPLQQPNLRGIL